MKNLMDDLDRWRTEGKRVVVARVVSVEGSAPQFAGAAMAVTEDGDVVGSIAGGCVEAAVVHEALEVLSGGGVAPRIVSFGCNDDDGFAAALTCGGTVDVFIEPFDW